MKCFVVAAALVGLAAGEPFLQGAPITTSYASVIAPNIHAAPAIHSVPAVPYTSRPLTPIIQSNVVPITKYSSQSILRTAPVTTIKAVPSGVTQQQYHSQDEFGNYAYGYANQNSEKHESGNAHTGVRGHYSYIDGQGLNRRVDYVADSLGFRASGSGVNGVNAALLRHKRSLSYGLNSYAPSLVAYPAVPLPDISQVATYASQPILSSVPVANIKAIQSTADSHQYHTQDEFGNYAYGYSNQNSEKHESGNAHTGVKGHYSYVDAYGLNRRVDYVADDAGFRASGNGVTGAAAILRHKRSLGYGLTSPTLALSHYPFAPIADVTPAVAYVSQPIAQTASLAKISAVPSDATSQQYHTQDEFGNYSYGYANQHSEKQESGNAHSGVKGHYSYVDAHGLNRRVDYVADALGFRSTSNF